MFYSTLDFSLVLITLIIILQLKTSQWYFLLRSAINYTQNNANWKKTENIKPLINFWVYVIWNFFPLWDCFFPCLIICHNYTLQPWHLNSIWYYTTKKNILGSQKRGRGGGINVPLGLWHILFSWSFSLQVYPHLNINLFKMYQKR